MSAITFGIDRVRLNHDLDVLERRLRAVKASAIPRASAQALNRTADRARSRTAREVARVKAVPVRLLKNRIAVFKASPRDLRSSVWVGLKKAIAIEDLPGARLVSQGKFAGHLKAGRLAVKVFEARMPSGKRGLFVRKLPGVRRSAGRPITSSPNLPIERPALRLSPEAQTIAEREGLAASREFLPVELRRLFQRELDRIKGA